MIRFAALIGAVLFWSACAAEQAAVPEKPAPKPPALTLDRALLMHPEAPEFAEPSPEVYRVRLDTSKGVIVIEVHRDWAPRGADRFYNLVRAGYYDGCKFSRVTVGWAQFGINGDPKISQAWRDETIPDDPVHVPQVSNAKGTVAFAFAVKDGRTTQIFFNQRDNASTHDHAEPPFVPFGRIVEGQDVADALNREYAERAGSGIRSGQQGPIFEQGNAWLEKNYPRLDYIRTAVIVP